MGEWRGPAPPLIGDGASSPTEGLPRSAIILVSESMPLASPSIDVSVTRLVLVTSDPSHPNAATMS